MADWDGGVGAAYVRLCLDGEEAVLLPGDRIGRLWTAELRIDDPSVSECHAYVSLRDGALRLLRLRGSLRVHGLEVDEVVLAAGQQISLSPARILSVAEVVIPTVTLGLSVDGRVVPLVGSMLVLGEDGRLVQGHGEGVSRFWSTGAGWMVQHRAAAPRPLEPGERFDAGRHSVEVIEIGTGRAEAPATVGVSRMAPLHLQANWDSVVLLRVGHAPGRLVGAPARVLTALAAFDGPVHWEVAAAEVWRRISDRHQLRRRWDRTLAALRRKLRTLGVRDDLVQTAGGQVELVLGADDRVEVDA